MQLEGCRIPALSEVFYVPDYLSEVEAQSLTVQATASKAKWVELSGRRLQSLGGSVHEKGLIPAPLPSWAQGLVARLHEDTQAVQLYGDTPPNHVLLNSYRPGEGIMPHEDGPAYYPGVCIVSLGAPAIIRFRRKAGASEGAPAGLGGGQAEGGVAAAVASLLLMPRSLLVFKGEAYTACLHGIDEVQEEVVDPSVANLHLCPPGIAANGVVVRGGERLSMTVRRVPRVIKGLLPLAGRR